MNFKPHFFLFLLICNTGYSQLKPVAQLVQDKNESGERFEHVSFISSVNKHFRDTTYKDIRTSVSIDLEELGKIVSNGYLAITTSLNFRGKTYIVDLVRVSLLTDDFSVVDQDGKAWEYKPGVYYRGIIKGDINSIAAFSFFEEEMVGVISNEEDHNIVIEKFKTGFRQNEYLIYSDKYIPFDFNCATAVSPNEIIPFDIEAHDISMLSTRCVNVYYEIDFDIFQRSNSNVQTTVNWMTGVHNAVATLFANDQISIGLRQVGVWTLRDPFDHQDSEEQLKLFRLIRPTFAGDVAHLIAIDNRLGGIAWPDRLCKDYNYAYSDVEDYESNLTTNRYSWTVGVITHEFGHSFGSEHTHACFWGPNRNQAIDGCGQRVVGENIGNCPIGPIPLNGGTIMSYCHLNGRPGINFSFGFGPQPAARIRNTINSASCLTSNSCLSTLGPITFPINNTCATATPIQSAITCNLVQGSLQNATQSLPPSSCNGFTSTAALDVWYRFTAVSTIHTITVNPSSGLDAVVELRRGPNCNGTLVDCRDNGGGIGRSEFLIASGLIIGQTYFIRVYPFYRQTLPSTQTFQLCITHSAAPTCSTPTGVIDNSISPSSANISWNPVAGATSYFVQYRMVGSSSASSFSANSNSASISGLACGTEYEWEVRAICGNLNSSFTTSRRFRTTTCPCPVPPQPSIISGNGIVCAGTSQNYSIASVQGALSYTWTYSGTASMGGSGTSISLAPQSSGILRVVANNACGSSTERTLSITVNPSLGQIGAINGNTIVCQGTLQTYSITPVAGAASYEWTLPSGWSGFSNTNAINATVGSAGGNISVRVSNSCGSGTRSVSVSMGQLPPQPGNITGNRTVCSGSSNTYSINPVSGATSYTWTFTGGGVPSGTSNSINFSPTSSGTLTVVANNGCGSGIGRSINLVVNTPPPTPGAISGSTIVCEGSSQIYSINPVGGATAYKWILPQGWTGNSSTNTITVNVGANSGIISVVATNNCGDGAARNLSISVNPKPGQPGTISGNTSICLGEQSTYSISQVQGANSYTWTYSGGGTPVGNTRSITFSPTSSGTITVVPNNQCGSGPSRTVQITVSQIPAIAGNITGNASPCRGSTVSYSVTPSVGATSYQWEIPTGWGGSSTSNTINVTVGQSNGVVRVRPVNQCGIGPWVQLGVTSLVAPQQPGAISGNSTPCESIQTQYSINTLATATSYTWSLPSGWSGNSTTRIINATPSITGGNISVRANNACGSSPVRSVAVQVIPKVVPTISVTETNCTGNTIEFTANYTGGGSNPQFQWYVNGQPEGSNSPTLTLHFAVNGMEVYCTMTSNAQCALPIKVQSNIAVVSCAASPKISVECVEMYLVYPNPANQQLFMKMRTTCDKKISLRLVNTKGQVLRETGVLQASGYLTETFDVRALQSAIYYLVLLVDGKQYPTKIMVRH